MIHAAPLPPHSDHYSFTSFNAEGVVRNQICTGNILNCSDITCIQEHHLFEYEADSGKLAYLFPGHSAHHKCFDQESLRDSTHRPSSGMHGVATLWKKELDPFMKRSNEGNSRVMVTLAELPNEKPICIINSYMPSGKTPDVIQAFLENADIVHEIIVKYDSSHDIWFGGDLNEDHYHRNSQKERKIKEILEEHGLTKVLNLLMNSHMSIHIWDTLPILTTYSSNLTLQKDGPLSKSWICRMIDLL